MDGFIELVRQGKVEEGISGPVREVIRKRDERAQTQSHFQSLHGQCNIRLDGGVTHHTTNNLGAGALDVDISPYVSRNNSFLAHLPSFSSSRSVASDVGADPLRHVYAPRTDGHPASFVGPQTPSSSNNPRASIIDLRSPTPTTRAFGSGALKPSPTNFASSPLTPQPYKPALLEVPASRMWKSVRPKKLAHGDISSTQLGSSFDVFLNAVRYTNKFTVSHSKISWHTRVKTLDIKRGGDACGNTNNAEAWSEG
ncbi:hypothetical protein MMC28_006950 [Mycoblastus sanguinarius]|nr:hypothetical protein [Mycoblastus sanguinarius]